MSRSNAMFAVSQMSTYIPGQCKSSSGPEPCKNFPSLFQSTKASLALSAQPFDFWLATWKWNWLQEQLLSLSMLLF